MNGVDVCKSRLGIALLEQRPEVRLLFRFLLLSAGEWTQASLIGGAGASPASLVLLLLLIPASSSSPFFLLFSGPAASGSRGSSSPRLPGVGSFLFSVSLLFHSSSLTVTSTEPLRGGHSPANWHLFQRSTKRRARGDQRPALIDKSSPFWAEPAPLIEKSSPFWAGAKSSFSLSRSSVFFFFPSLVSSRVGGAALLVLQNLWAVEPQGFMSSTH